MAFQESSYVPLTALLPGKAGLTVLSPRKDANPSSNLGNTRSQAGNKSASEAVRCSTRLRVYQASQADSTIPQVDSKISLVCQAASQAVRHSTRLRVSQADSAIPQVDSKVSQASGPSPP